MRILVYPHMLSIGGSQLNAVELAAACRDLGHEVLIYGLPGALNDRIAELGLEFVESPSPGRRPSPRVAADLRRLVRARRIEMVHAYEWPPALEARIAVVGTPAALVTTVMSMAVPPFLPQRIPLVVGTEQIAAYERSRGRREVWAIEPPVDLNHNVLDVGGAEAFRRQHGIPRDVLHVVCVTRLARELKLEGILTAIRTIPTLAPETVLTVVGDGPEQPAVKEAADEANAVAGRRAVVLTGEIRDPRPAYSSADVVLGMGGSALRALAFGKALIVQGEQGFWSALSERTAQHFLWTGWFGLGTGTDEGGSRLTAELQPLLVDMATRCELGSFGYRLVRERYSLEAAASRQVELYRAASQGSAQGYLPRADDMAGAVRFIGYKADRKLRAWRGHGSQDDFNDIRLLRQVESRTALSKPPSNRSGNSSAGRAAEEPS